MKKIIPTISNPNFSEALNEANIALVSIMEVGVVAIISKYTFSITSKMPVKNGVIGIYFPIVWIVSFDLWNTRLIKLKDKVT